MVDFVLKGKGILNDIEISNNVRAKLRNLKITLQGGGQAASQLRQIATQAQRTAINVNAVNRSLRGTAAATAAIARVQNNIIGTNRQLTNASKSAKTFSDEIINIAKRAFAFRVATIGINATANAIGDATTFLQKFDSQLIDIQKTTGIAGQQLDELGTNIIKLGGQYGLAAEDVAESFKSIVQAGFQGNRALQFATVAAQGAAATTLDFAQATELVIQVARQFGETEVAGIFDKIAIAEDKTAASAKDFQEAFERAGATLKEVGATTSQALGLIGALAETTRRGGAVVGNSLRSIATRLFAGESRQALQNLGVAVADSTGKLRNIVDVLSDVKTKFASLTESQKIQAATTIAGRFQFENFLVAVDKVNRAIEVSTAADNAQGEAARRAALNNEKLTSKFENLRDSALNAIRGINEVIPVIDGLKQGVDAVNSLTKAFDGLLGKIVSILSFSSALAGFGKLLGFGKTIAGATGPAASTFGFSSLVRSPQLRQRGLGQQLPRLAAGAVDKLFNISGFIAARQKIASQTLGIGGSFKALSAAFANSFFAKAGAVASISIALDVLSDNADTLAKKLPFAGSATNEVIKEFASLGTTASVATLALGPLGGAIFAVAKVAFDLVKFFKENEARNAIEEQIKAEEEKNGILGESAKASLRAALVAKELGDKEEELANIRAASTKRLIDNVNALKSGKGKPAETSAKNVQNILDNVFENIIPPEVDTEFKTLSKLIQDSAPKGDIFNSYENLKNILETQAAISSRFNPNAANAVSKAIQDIGHEINRFVATVGNEDPEKLNDAIEGFAANITKEFAGFTISEKTLQEKLKQVAEKAVEGLDFSTLIKTQPQIVFDTLSKAIGRTVTTATEAAEALSEISKNLKPSPINFKFTREQFSLGDFLKEFAGAKREVQEGALAEKIFRENITESIALRKLQGEVEIQAAQDSLSDSKDLFRQAFTDLFRDVVDNTANTDISSIDIGKKLVQAIQEDIDKSVKTGEISSGGRVFEVIQKSIGSFGQGVTSFSPEKLEALVKAVLDLEEKSAKLGGTFAETGQAIRNIRLDKFLEDLDKDTSARLDNIGAIEALSQSLLDFKGRIGNTRESLIDTSNSFNDLSTLAAKGLVNPQEFLNLAKATQQSDNEIVKAKMEIRDLGRSATFTLSAIAARKKVLEQEAAQLGQTEKEEDKRKDIVKQLNQLESEQAEFTLKTRQDLIDKMRKLIQQEKQEAEKNFKDDAAAQGELQSAEKATIDATDNLAKSYRSLLNAQVALSEAVADYKIGILSARREIGIINGTLKGFDSQFGSIKNIFDSVLRDTFVTETKRLELIKQSNQQQLSLIEETVNETKSIGEKLFTAAPETGRELIEGFAGIRQILGNFQSQGGFNKVDLNDFGNKLLALPQQLRENIAQALSFLPETATVGGFSKDEIQKVLFGSAVGESQEANIKNINELTKKQVELISSIAENDKGSIIAAQTQVASAQEAVETAKEQLALAKTAQDRAKENAILVRDQIIASATEIAAADISAGAQTAVAITDVKGATIDLTNTVAAQTNETNRILQGIQDSLLQFTGSLSSFVETGTTISTKARGYIPNFASNNEVKAIIDAYNREKRQGPAGSKPVIANDSEIIIPTRHNGQIPNYQNGKGVAIDTSTIEELLNNLIEEVKTKNSDLGNPEKKNIEPIQEVQATININSKQEVQVTGAVSIAQAIANALKDVLGPTVTVDQLGQVTKVVEQIFYSLKNKGLISSFGVIT